MAAVLETTPGDAGQLPDGKIGRDGEILRAFNFSGGGFNTVMQLGVTHALLVTQGRAPDVVVGVSAGAIQAAALAEIMRNGDVPATPIKPAYEVALNERVACFRRVVDACHRAPEDLADALLPDAYQIESFDPLAPLGQPTLDAREREERREWLIGKAGLARLYNELLGLHIPVGVIAHLVRRFLGWRAVGNIGRDNWTGAALRKIAQISEIMKVLLLASEHLARFAPLVLMLLSPMIGGLYGDSRRASEQDAESIMSRFGILERLAHAWKTMWSLLLVLNVWLCISLIVLMPLVLPVVQLIMDPEKVHVVGIVLMSMWLALILSPLVPPIVRLDRRAFSRVALVLLKGVTVFAWNSIKWLLVTLALTTIPVVLLAMFVAVTSRTGLFVEDRNDFWVFMAVIPGGVALVFLVLGLLRYVADWFEGPMSRRTFALRGGEAVVRAFVGALLAAVALLVTYGVDELLQPIVDFLNFGPRLDRLLALGGFASVEQVAAIADAASNRPLDMEQLERAAQLDLLSWPQRLVLDLLVGIVFVSLTALTSFVLVTVAVVWIWLSYVFRIDSTIDFYGWFLRRFLHRYQIGASLANGYPLKRFLISLFDPGYYGEKSLVQAADAALSDSRAAIPTTGPEVKARTRIAHYAQGDKGRPPIRLALAVANLTSGKLDVIPNNYDVIDALMAANAYAPIFPPVKLGNALYADAINIGNVPTRALLRLMRRDGVADISALHIYAVDPLPVSQDKLSPPIDAEGKQKTTPYLNLVDTASRALQLQRFRDAKVERRLTSIFTELLPKGVGALDVTFGEKKKRFFRAYTAPVELDRPIDLNAQILYAPKEQRRAALAETVAMGCRAALQVMLAQTLASHEIEAVAHGRQGARFISCSKAVAFYKANTGGHPDINVPGMGLEAPGLAEVCKHCSIKNELGKVVEHQGVEARRSLRILGGAVAKEIVDWPQEVNWQPAKKAEQEAPPEDMAAASPAPPSKPAARACLFGGGVFRGVFQMGVLSALAMVKFKPTLVAGASVGSITAAMTAVLLDEKDAAKQHKDLADLASVYLSIDRLVLTDRFSDFVRNWTVRAGEARFSIREADRVFRKYDFDAAPIFQRTFRAVVAGIERLFYINPYQLNEIVSAARHRRAHELLGLLKDRAQGWLDRMHVGTEILGAEPLCQLIEQFVVDKIPHQKGQVVRLKHLSQSSRLLATTTNLTQGALRVLGSKQESRTNPATITLTETLLASSAFPGVFRPRRSWDLLPGDNDEDEYVDGGIVDNLPLDPVLQDLRAQAEIEGSLDVRPLHPHLLVAASLEPVYRPISDQVADAMAAHWPDVQTRLRELQYNVKLDMYRFGLDDVSGLYEEVRRQGKTSPRESLKVKLVAVQPEWLCSTFAFHPMLGFRRTHQAKSIAHGCASTLCALAEVRDGAHEKWGLDEAAIPPQPLEAALLLPPPGRDKYRAGKCWLRPEITCPFSKKALEHSKMKDSAHWVAEIHRHCWDAKTHRRDAII